MESILQYPALSECLIKGSFFPLSVWSGFVEGLGAWMAGILKRL